MDYEADQFESRFDMATDESLAATRRIRKVAEDTNQIGIDTLGTLHDQGEQLNYIENQVNEIEVGLREADQHLHEIEKCCGCCVCPWNRVNSPTRVKVQKSYGSSMKPPVVTSQPKHSHGGNGKGATGVGGGYIQTVTNDDRENEMNDNLGATDNALRNMKSMARSMGNELDRQNKQIDRLNTKVQNQDHQLKPINQRIRQQLK